VTMQPLVLRSALGNIKIKGLNCQLSQGMRINLLVRPDGVNLIKGDQKGIVGKVRDCVFQGHYYRTEVTIGGETLNFEFPDETKPGTRINIMPKENGIVLLEICK
jgi:ABC-type sugar transport system ATPase subunit